MVIATLFTVGKRYKHYSALKGRFDTYYNMDEPQNIMPSEIS